MAEPSPPLDDSLPHRFVSEVETAIEGNYTTIRFPSQDIIAIAGTPTLQQKLLSLIDGKQNGIDIGRFIADHAEDVLDAQQRVANKAEGWIEFIDRSLLAVSAAAIMPSLVLMVNQAAAGGVGWAPVVLLVGGVSGLLISGGVRFAIRDRVNRLKASISKLERLSERLRRR